MAVAGGATTAYIVTVNRLYDGTLDWNHRKSSSTSAQYSVCDKPEEAVNKLKQGMQALIAGYDIVEVEKLIKKEQEKNK